MKKVLCYLVLLLPLGALAEVQKILDISAQSDATVSSLISVDLGDQKNVASLIYQPDTATSEIKTFTTNRILQNDVALKTRSGIEIIGLQLRMVSNNNYRVKLHYLYQFKLFGKIYKDKYLNVFYSATESRYLVQDDETKVNISRLHFISHFNDSGIEVGIERIETK